jgi:hypothetical protein
LPRFGTKTLLLGFSLVALWLSTIYLHAVGSDIRDAIIFVISGASLLGAIYYRGRRQAFCIGFFVTVLAVAVNAAPNYPRFSWIRNLLSAYDQYQNLPNGALNYRFDFFNDSIRALVKLLLATLIGYLGIRIYEHSLRIND